jgi:WD40 repeat protein
MNWGAKTSTGMTHAPFRGGTAKGDTSEHSCTNGSASKSILSLIAPLPVEKLAVLRTLTGHRGYVYSVAVSADGRRLFSASRDETIKVWGA